MFILIKHTLTALARESSKDFSLSLGFCLLLQIISEIQVISITLRPLSLINSTKLEAHFIFQNMNKLMSILGPFYLWDQLDSVLIAKCLVGFYSAYLFFQIMFLACITYQAYKQAKIRDWIAKLFTLSLLIHSRVIFYLIHYFGVRIITSYSTYCKNEVFPKAYYCEPLWVAIASVISSLNLILALFKEIWFYQIRRCKNGLSAKDNFYPLFNLIQKTLIIYLLCGFKSTKVQIIVSSFNLVFSFTKLFILHQRLSFYNIKVLKTVIVICTGLANLSLFCLLKIINIQFDLIFFMLFALPLTIKLSLIGLDHTFSKILRLEAKSTCQIIHLPILLKHSFGNLTTFRGNKNINKSTFLFSQLLKDKVADLFILKDISSIRKAKVIAYSTALNYLLKYLKRNPDNVLLSLSAVQIYIKHLKDFSNALTILGRLKSLNLNISARNSCESINSKLKTTLFKASILGNENYSYLSYFSDQKKTLEFKKNIQKEIQDHVLFLEVLGKESVDVKALVKYARNVTDQSETIEKIWQNMSQLSFERQHVSICILYGIYVNLVQEFSHLGNSIIQKAYKTMQNNKEQSQKRLTDIILGRSAAVIISLDAGKLGKVVNASSSVTNLFEVKKETLIGSDIGMIMPKIISKNHNKFLEKHKNNPQYNFTRQVVSLAKTVNDKYFEVEIDVQLYPCIDQGICLVGSITKKSSYVTVIITNCDGKVVESSVELLGCLGTKETVTNSDLCKICPDFAEINKLFNVAHQPMTEEQLFSFNYQPNHLKQSTNLEHDIIISSPGRARLTTGDDNEYKKLLFRSEQTNIGTDTEDNFSVTRKLQKAPSDFLQRDQAKIICESLTKEGRNLRFCFNNSRMLRNSRIEMEFETKIEPYILDGEIYKILRMKHVRSSKQLLPSVLKAIKNEDFSIPDEFPSDEEQDKSSAFEKVRRKQSDQALLGPNLIRLSKKFDYLKRGSNTSFEEKLEVEQSQAQRSKVSPLKTRTSSILDFQEVQKSKDKGLHTIFNQYYLSQAIKTAIFIFYIIIAGVIIVAIIDYIFKTRSLNNMKDAMSLIEIVYKRMLKTTSSWLSILVVYARSTGLRPMTSFVKGLQNTARDASIEMLDTSNLLKMKVNNLDNTDIVQLFYKKTISLWEPYQNQIYFGTKLDSFMANQILADYGIFVGNYPGSLLELNQRREVVFALNNTANDFLISVEEAINQVEAFSIQSNQGNLNLLISICLAKVLTLVIPLILIIFLFRSVIRSYERLLKALYTIQSHKLKQRIENLKNLNVFLEKNVEENLASYNMRQLAVLKIQSDQAGFPTFHSVKQHSFKGLYIYFGKYFFFLVLMGIPVFGLFIFTFLKTYQGLSSLNVIMKKMIVTSKLGTQIALINPSFYFVAIFENQTSFKIRNQEPADQLLYHLSFLEEANNILTNTLSTPGKGIDDAFIEGFLKTNVCDYMPANYLNFCLNVTRRNSFGILGLNSDYLNQASSSLKDYLKTPTREKIQQVWGDLAPVFGNLAPVVKKAYEILPEYFLKEFVNKADDELDSALWYLTINLFAIFISSLLIRITIFNKLKELDKGIRKILRVVPFQFIEENKFIKHYLSQEFRKELKDFETF